MGIRSGPKRFEAMLSPFGLNGQVESALERDLFELAQVLLSEMERESARRYNDETWKLSEDGKVINITNQLSTPQGDFEVKIVLEKQ